MAHQNQSAWIRVFMAMGRLIWRVKARGAENLPQGGALLVCNHVSYIDAVILRLACPRPIRFMSQEEFFHTPVLGAVLRLFQTIPISSKKAREALQTAAERIQAGELVCIFPEGELTRTGKLMGFKKGFELIARQASAPVVPVHLDSLWGSIFSFYGNRYFLKLPRKLPFRVTVSFGKPLSPEDANAMTVRRQILDLGEAAFRARKELDFTLGYAALLALSKKPWRALLVDRTQGRQAYSRGFVFGISLALARRWRKRIPEKRVGIALPPGFGGTVANLAVVFAGKIPVNLNVIVGKDAAESSLQCAEIRTVASADAVKKRFPHFPWPENTLDIREEINQCGRFSIILCMILGCLLPHLLLARWMGVKRKNGDAEAVLLFTSGSSGEPKGVVLSHRNILANVAQINATNLIERKDAVLAGLPLFHSFGMTVTLWYPLLEGCSFVSTPSPLDAKKIGEAAREEKVAILIGTPTFLRSYWRKLDESAFSSVRFAIAGAEKLPTDLVEAYQKKFGVLLLEGYGLTETTPVAAVNVPNPVLGLGTSGPQIGWRVGSVGRLLPGMTARITHPETRAELPMDQTGMLELRGANVFQGYLKDEKRTNEVLKDGWFITGDLGRFDEDGFLYLEGRLSRFSKIGGEMVPHGVVESKII
ncbi:MAG: AMP-binding protein, partial [bacterium]